MTRPQRVACTLLSLGLVAFCMVPAKSHTVGASRPVQEAAFLRTVDPRDTANVVTGDLVHYAGTHVAYACDVDNVVRAGVILGQCGSAAEPLDLFIHLPTSHVHTGDRLSVLGIMEPPAAWTDVSGHTVYYAFVKAIFVNRLK